VTGRRSSLPPRPRPLEVWFRDHRPRRRKVTCPGPCWLGPIPCRLASITPSCDPGATSVVSHPKRSEEEASNCSPSLPTTSNQATGRPAPNAVSRAQLEQIASRRTREWCSHETLPKPTDATTGEFIACFGLKPLWLGHGSNAPGSRQPSDVHSVYEEHATACQASARFLYAPNDLIMANTVSRLGESRHRQHVEIRATDIEPAV
jgi:hypothetical protein